MVEVHHIVPQAAGGSDTLDNAAPLCAGCHDVFGGNPEKRKQIREARDLWWEIVRERHERLTVADAFEDMLSATLAVGGVAGLSSTPALLYHCVFAEEQFESSAEMIVTLIHRAQQAEPGRPRVLYLDIDGHRNALGGFDADTWELQKYFIPGCLGRYLKEIHMPLGSFRAAKAQRNDIPPTVRIFAGSTGTGLGALNSVGEGEVYVADVGKWFRVSE